MTNAVETRPSSIRPAKTGLRVVWREPSDLYHRTAASISALNHAMIQLVPELDSKYATAPMYFPQWKNPSDILENGDPCFIAAKRPDDGDSIRQDYIWMPKQNKHLPAGYYHLQTQEAYIQVFARIKKQRPCNVFKQDDKYERIYRLIENRITYDRPNDRYGIKKERKRTYITLSKVLRGGPPGALIF